VGIGLRGWRGNNDEQGIPSPRLRTLLNKHDFDGRNSARVVEGKPPRDLADHFVEIRNPPRIALPTRSRSCDVDMDCQGVAIEPNRQWLQFMKRLRFLGKYGKRNANDATDAVQIGAPTLELRPADPCVFGRRGRIVYREHLASARIPRSLLNLRQQGRSEFATHLLDDAAAIAIGAKLELNPKVSAHDAGSLGMRCRVLKYRNDPRHRADGVTNRDKVPTRTTTTSD
jgi:hypothetical protein